MESTSFLFLFFLSLLNSKTNWQSVTRSIFPRTDFFGTQVDERVRSSLEQIETEDEDATILGLLVSFRILVLTMLCVLF